MASSDINSVILVGRLTRDAEVTYLQGSGTPVGKLAIAVNRSKKDGDQWVSEASFFDVTLFGKQADALKRYLTKGKQIAVQGSLRQNRWEKDGQKFNKIDIIADDIQLLGGRSDNSDNGSYGSSNGNSSGYNGGSQNKSSFTPKNQDNQYSQQNYQSSENESFGGDVNGFPEDIPF